MCAVGLQRAQTQVTHVLLCRCQDVKVESLVLCRGLVRNRIWKASGQVGVPVPVAVFLILEILDFFPKQFTVVGVLNATLDLAALVLVGVVGFLGSEVVLSPVVSGCLPSCGGWVLVGVAAFLGSEVVLSPVVSGCLPSCRGWVLVGVAASRTKTFRNQNHRFQSKFASCKLFGVYAGVITLKYLKMFIL